MIRRLKQFLKIWGKIQSLFAVHLQIAAVEQLQDRDMKEASRL